MPTLVGRVASLAVIAGAAALVYTFEMERRASAAYVSGNITSVEASVAEERVWKNNMLLGSTLAAALPPFAASWLRNFIAGESLYLVVGSLWAAWVYGLCRSRCFPGGDEENIASRSEVYGHIWMSTKSMTMYTLMPTIGEWAVENGYTQCYARVADVGGWRMWALYTFVYLVWVEFGIWWVHRGVHYGFLYKYVHKPHHHYTKPNMLSPFAGLAFAPHDGMAQASPYVIGLFLLPVHVTTYTAMLFFTAIWTTCIHDTLIEPTEPIMGAGYHTVHHTDFDYNYGQFFIFWDWFYDTLKVPKWEPKPAKGGKKTM